MIDFRRVQKEVQDCEKDKDGSGIKICPKSDNLTSLIGTIPGPISSPYQGGTFHIDITITERYPLEPPKMQFLTKVWHPNISSQSGAICLDVLKHLWSPALSLRTLLVSIQALLSSPEPKEPQDAVVAEQYLKNYRMFESTARFWTESFAKSYSLEDKVKRLLEMGFGDDQVRIAIESSGGDENMALEKLCSG